MKINVLSKETADKIAAGEVIENPLSVIKELVENSIDAESSFITVEIKDGGKSYIRVSDNGIGIDKEDVEKAFLPHATSKLSDDSDLYSISSLGFRGEALTSIAAVSITELLTKTDKDKTGTHIFLEAGIIKKCEEAARETGTTVIVKDLFFNLPARRKFLKSDSRESSNITDFISKMSIAYPNIKFRLIVNGNILFTTSGKGDIYQTIQTVYNPQRARKLIKIDYSRNGLRVYGYISSPLESQNNRKYQIFFVNGRLISSKVLDQAVKMAYEDKLFEGRYPSAYLFIELDPSKTDVNIHPRKAEIKFFDDDVVRDFIIEAIRHGLLDSEATALQAEDVTKINEPLSNNSINKFSLKEIEFTNPTVSFESDSIFKTLRSDELKEEPIQVQEEFIDYNTKDEFVFAHLKPIGQIFNTYILAVDDDNFYLIDQHAAHERVMYEKLLNGFNNINTNGQILISPITMDLNPGQMVTLSESCQVLDSLGFCIDEFGLNNIVVKEIPSFMSLDEAELFLKEFFDTPDELKNSIQIKKDQIISKACKSAVKAHDKLSQSEILALLKELDNCDNPFSCPHGRPTFIKMSEYEIERMFKRK